jgi:hypothetical protein
MSDKEHCRTGGTFDSKTQSQKQMREKERGEAASGGDSPPKRQESIRWTMSTFFLQKLQSG